MVGAERRLLSAALWRQLCPARRSRQCVADLRRCQPGFHLYILRPAHGRHISHSLRPLAVDGGDDDVQCRQLRDHGGRQRRQHRRAGLSPDPNACRADGHAARDHGDGRCQEPRLWRRQSGADLAGRRRGSRQWRQPVGRAGDVGDDRQQCRRLRDHARARWQPRPTTRCPTTAPTSRSAARHHRDGRCQEPRLWRRQSGADLAGRRRGSGQWRQPVGRAGDVGDGASNVGVYGITPGHAGGLDQLRADLQQRQPHVSHAPSP